MALWNEARNLPVKLCLALNNLLLSLCEHTWISKMPKGVYDRGPCKKAKGSNSGGFPSRKLDKSSFGRKPSNIGAAQGNGKRGSPNQVTRTLSPEFIFGCNWPWKDHEKNVVKTTWQI